MKTLIVEDDPTSRLLLEAILAPYGETAAAENGQEGLDLYRASREAGKAFNLICMDIMMPDMDGQDCLKEIRAIEKSVNVLPGKDTVIIMTTALHDPGNVKKAFAENCDAYLVKPIDKAKLIDELKAFGLI